MKSSFLVILLSILTISCTSASKMFQLSALGNNSINLYAETMKKDNWIRNSYGGGAFSGKYIKTIHVGFKVPAETFDIAHARTLILNGIETFLDSINSDLILIPHLHHFPFTYQDLEYVIMIGNGEGEYLGRILLLNGKIYYQPCSSISSFQLESNFYEETYPEALINFNLGLAIPAPLIESKEI